MKWPSKREGAYCSNAPIPKLTGLASNNSASSKAQACAHLATRTEQMPAGGAHYAREVCVECGRYVRWLPRPETVERQRVNAFSLAKLSMCEGLSDWERGFVRDVSRQRKLSPKQQALVERLAAEHLEGTP